MADHDHLLLLALAKDALQYENGFAWKIDAYEASRVYGERCDRVWAELRRQLAERGDIALPHIPPPIADQTLGIRRELKQLLIERLPELIEEAIGEM